MTDELRPVLRGVGGLPANPHVNALPVFLSGPRKMAASATDRKDFARFADDGDNEPAATADLLLSLPHGSANALALGNRALRVERGPKAATIAR